MRASRDSREEFNVHTRKSQNSVHMCTRIERGKRVMRVEPGVLRAHRSLFELNRVVRAAPDNASDCRRGPELPGHEVR